jgi:hypothetical protein
MNAVHKMDSNHSDHHKYFIDLEKNQQSGSRLDDILNSHLSVQHPAALTEHYIHTYLARRHCNCIILESNRTSRRKQASFNTSLRIQVDTRIRQNVPHKRRAHSQCSA